jgi:dihydroorotate dehydrogenase (fumarate)
LELNIYNVAADPSLCGADIEEQYLEIVKTLKQIKIPIAVKLSPFFTSTAHMAKQLDDAGADALVLFNRFYQPDIDLENLEIIPNVILSSPFAMRLPMRWIAILHGRVGCSLAATGGIHTAKDVLKMMMAGANVAMVCSVLLKHGIHRIREILEQMETWMTEHEYESVAQMQGSMSQKSCGNPSDFERVHYMKALTGYHV